MLNRKAIEINELNIKVAGKQMPPDVLDALKQSVKALKYCEEVKRFPHLVDQIPLPNEEDD